ncbi:efflux transporter outer membrane subunit [Psychrobacter lutiphocae]|uniref:efflux transporter outer membrane subunit n=1 Tax=Psychrobacter lutiphocae TaxID=540500 RepID=UPI000366B77B|nr:TolC family protein [Psychrobacter lutiphocae]
MYRLSKIATLTTLALFINACQTPQGTQVQRSSEVPIPASFDKAKAAQGSQEITQWWQNWHDPLLSQLITQGLQNSYDIRIAESRLKEAMAISRLANANLGPQAGIGGSVGIGTGSVEPSKDGKLYDFISNTPIPLPGVSDLYDRRDVNAGYASVGFSASWEPDIFGQKQSDADAAYYAAMGMQEKIYGAQLLVANQIAEHYLAARAAEQRQQIAAQNIATLTRYERYVKGRFNAGDVSIQEVNNIQSKLNAARAKMSTLQAERDAHARSIAVLTGQTPQGFVLPKASNNILATQPQAPSGQTPPGLLERRPDIRAYASQIRAYSAKLASAEADLLPRFSINFLGQGGRIELDSDAPDLKGWGSLLSVGINVPIFTNGRIEANIEGADARLQTALLEYDKSILQALGEVDSAYQTHHALDEQNALLNTAYQHAQKRASDAEKLFRYGHQTLDKALDAQIEFEQIQELMVDSQLARANMLLNIYKALGGGWQPTFYTTNFLPSLN